MPRLLYLPVLAILTAAVRRVRGDGGRMARRGATLAMAAVLGAARAEAGGRDLEMRVLVRVPVAATRAQLSGALAALVHGENVYVATPDGLSVLREEGSAAALELLNRVTGIHALAVIDGTLFMARSPDATSLHSVLRSSDGGRTSVPADAGLESCFTAGGGGAQCDLLGAVDLEVDSGTLLGNFGNLNIFTWDPARERWRLFLGTGELHVCYAQPFELVGRRVLVGGECPLDFAYLKSAPSRRDGTPIPFERLREVAHPRLQNRNVQFIAQRRDTAVVFAGVEGGLLRSTDRGRRFGFVLRFSGAPYPYISQILFPTAEPRAVLVAGSSQSDEPFVARSADGGRSWRDLSRRLPSEIPRTGAAVEFLVERNPASVLLGITRRNEASGFIGDVVLVEASAG